MFVLQSSLYFAHAYIISSHLKDTFSSEEQLEFPVLYASAKEGWASSTYTKNPPDDARNMSELLDAIIRHVPPPNATLDAPFQMLVSAVIFHVYLISFAGICALYRIHMHELLEATPILCI